MNLWTQLAAFSFIETEHSFLRPILFGDAESLYKIASNPDNTEFIFPTESSLQESEYVIANYFMKNPLGIWAICDKETNEMIGSIKFEKMDEIKKEAERLLGTGPDDRSCPRIGFSFIYEIRF